MSSVTEGGRWDAGGLAAGGAATGDSGEGLLLQAANARATIRMRMTGRYPITARYDVCVKSVGVLAAAVVGLASCKPASVAVVDAADANGGNHFCALARYGPITNIPFVASTQMGTVDRFFAGACNPGDAIVVQVGCISSRPIASVSLSAPGWEITPLGAVTGSPMGSTWAASFGAIAPDRAAAEFTVEWTPATCERVWQVGDQFEGVDSSGGATTFDAHAEAFGHGTCRTTLAIGHDRDLVWAAAGSPQNAYSNVSPFFSLSLSDGLGDWSMYRFTTDLAGTLETAMFMTSTNEDCVNTTVAIKPH